MIAVAQDGWLLHALSAELRADFDIVKTAVTNDGEALQWASEALKSNATIVYSAVTSDGTALTLRQCRTAE